MNARTTWQEKVDAYVAERRRAGFKLSIAATQLASFARFAQLNAPRSSLTLELASRWALASRHGARLTAARRIRVDPIRYTGGTLSLVLNCKSPPLHSSSPSFHLHRSAVSRGCGRSVRRARF